MSTNADTIREALELGWPLSNAEEEMAALRELLAEVEQLRAALERIATERRPDGTYNLSREACEQIAREALGAVRG